jgi:Spy/CpxP family protein refolding chaperone
MFSSKIAAIFLGSAIGATAVAAPLAANNSFGPAHLRNTPLGRLITGNVGRLMVLRSELNLSEKQRSSVRSIVKGHKQEIATVAKSVHDKRKSLRDVVMSDSATEDEIRRAADALGDAISDAAVLGAKVRREVKPVLTEEQRTKIREFISDRDSAIDRFLAGVDAE